MAYYNYASQQVFLDNNVNALCDTIMASLVNQFTLSIVNTNFCVTGSTSRIMQGAANVPIPCVAFATDSEDIYEYLRININTIINVIYAHIFSDRFQVVNIHCLFEVWFREVPLVTINSGGIYIENTANIPSNIL